MEINARTAVNTACKLSCSTLVGMGAAATLSISPVIGAGLAATALLASTVVSETITYLPTFEDDSKITHKFVGTLALAGAWILTATQIAQVALKIIFGVAVPLLPAFIITASSLVIGSQLLGSLLSEQALNELPS